MSEKKEISKISKTFKGLFGSDKVSYETLQYRLSKCNACPYNSKNATELSAVDTLRKAASSKDFCTLCKCFIKEKAESPLEMCAKYIKKEPLEWNRKKIEIMGNESVNIELVTPNEGIKFDFIGGNYKIDYGVVTEVTNNEIDVLVSVDKNSILNIFNVESSCGCVGVSGLFRNDSNSYGFKITANTSLIGMNMPFNKQITITYSIDTGVQNYQLIDVKGYRN